MSGSAARSPSTRDGGRSRRRGNRSCPEHVGLDVQQGHALEAREVRRPGSHSRSISSSLSIATFSGRVTPHGVRWAPWPGRAAAPGGGPGRWRCRPDRDRAAGRGRRSPPTPSTSRTARTRSGSAAARSRSSSRSPTMSAHETLRFCAHEVVQLRRWSWSRGPDFGARRRARPPRAPYAAGRPRADDRDRVPAGNTSRNVSGSPRSP